MARRCRFGRLILLHVGIVACSFDASGVGASAGMSIGEVGTAPTDTGDPETSTVESSATESNPETGDVSSGESSSDCAGGGTCAATAPGGWIGPFAVNTASPPNASQQCPQGWTEHGSGFVDLVALPATCDCNCVPSAATCTVDATYYSDSACTIPNEAGSSSGGCDNLSTQTNHDYVRVIGEPAGVGCSPAEQYVVPPTAWNEASVMCSPPQMPVCDQGVCLPVAPPGFEDRWCVMADGEQACPGGPYSAQRIRYSSLTDTRGCTPCGCSVQGTPTCAGPFREYTVFCSVQLDEVTIDGECQPSLAGAIDAWSVRYDGPGAAFMCANNAPTPVGAAVATDPITICCTE